MRRFIPGAIFAFLFVALLLAAQSPDGNAIGGQLIHVERDSWAQRKAGNAEYFNQVPGDYQAAMPNGSTETRADLRQRARNAPLDSYELKDFRVSFAGDTTATVQYVAQYAGHWQDGTRFDGLRRVVSHWEVRNGRWENVKTEFLNP